MLESLFGFQLAVVFDGRFAALMSEKMLDNFVFAGLRAQVQFGRDVPEGMRVHAKSNAILHQSLNVGRHHAGALRAAVCGGEQPRGRLVGKQRTIFRQIELQHACRRARQSELEDLVVLHLFRRIEERDGGAFSSMRPEQIGLHVGVQ